MIKKQKNAVSKQKKKNSSIPLKRWNRKTIFSTKRTNMMAKIARIICGATHTNIFFFMGIRELHELS